MKNILNSDKETIKEGEKLGRSLKGGDIVFLSGILGSGKTVFTRGLAKGLGVKNNISSPTFNLFRVYPLPKGKFYHFDCYRLSKYKELKELGWEEITSDKDNIVALEWPECIEDKDITKGTNINVSIEMGKSADERIANIKV